MIVLLQLEYILQLQNYQQILTRVFQNLSTNNSKREMFKKRCRIPSHLHTKLINVRCSLLCCHTVTFSSISQRTASHVSSELSLARKSSLSFYLATIIILLLNYLARPFIAIINSC